MTTQEDRSDLGDLAGSPVDNTVSTEVLNGNVAQAHTINGGVHFHAKPQPKRVKITEEPGKRLSLHALLPVAKKPKAPQAITGRRVYTVLPAWDTLKSMRMSEVAKLVASSDPAIVARHFVWRGWDVGEGGFPYHFVCKQDLRFFAAILDSLPPGATHSVLRRVERSYRFKLAAGLKPELRLAVIRLMDDSNAAGTLSRLPVRSAAAIVSDFAAAHAYRVTVKMSCPRFRTRFDLLRPEFVAHMLRDVDIHSCLDHLTAMKRSNAAAVLQAMHFQHAAAVVAIMKPELSTKLLRLLPVEVKAAIG